MEKKNGFYMSTYYVGYIWWKNEWCSFEDIDAYEEYIEEHIARERR